MRGLKAKLFFSFIKIANKCYLNMNQLFSSSVLDCKADCGPEFLIYKWKLWDLPDRI